MQSLMKDPDMDVVCVTKGIRWKSWWRGCARASDTFTEPNTMMLCHENCGDVTIGKLVQRRVQTKGMNTHGCTSQCHFARHVPVSGTQHGSQWEDCHNKIREQLPPPETEPMFRLVMEITRECIETLSACRECGTVVITISAALVDLLSYRRRDIRIFNHIVWTKVWRSETNLKMTVWFATYMAKINCEGSCVGPRCLCVQLSPQQQTAEYEPVGSTPASGSS